MIDVLGSYCAASTLAGRLRRPIARVTNFQALRRSRDIALNPLLGAADALRYRSKRLLKFDQPTAISVGADANDPQPDPRRHHVTDACHIDLPRAMNDPGLQCIWQHPQRSGVTVDPLTHAIPPAPRPSFLADEARDIFQ
jgi:hypothetical protein